MDAKKEVSSIVSGFIPRWYRDGPFDPNEFELQIGPPPDENYQVDTVKVYVVTEAYNIKSVHASIDGAVDAKIKLDENETKYHSIQEWDLQP